MSGLYRIGATYVSAAVAMADFASSVAWDYRSVSAIPLYALLRRIRNFAAILLVL